ncbi:MAG: HAD hydrolase family protein [Candidatus Omnitrophica bacterium]|nr:HAD hydrolase family protein [Candidatus Omnitrophota bacterium]
MPAPLALPQDVLQRAARVSLLVLDVDGVLTDGRIVYADYGDELKFFDVQDGAGLVFWNRVGLRSAIITSRSSRLLKRRAKELRVDHLAQKCLLKLPAYEQLLKRLRVSGEQVCAIGDDLMDLPLLRRAGLAVAVSNAVDEVKAVAHYVTRRAGGRGAVREVVDIILRTKGLWDEVLQRYQ